MRDRHVNHRPSVITAPVKTHAEGPHGADDYVPASKRMTRATGERTKAGQGGMGVFQAKGKNSPATL